MTTCNHLREIEVSNHSREIEVFKKVLFERELLNGNDVSYALSLCDHHGVLKILSLHNHLKFHGMLYVKDFVEANFKEFSILGKMTIVDGLNKSMDVMEFANGLYDDDQMHLIKDGILQRLDVSLYKDPKFNAFQMLQIYTGLRDGLDASLYAKKSLNAAQMVQIRQGLKEGVDISLYADKRFSSVKMALIREGLLAGLDVSSYADHKLTFEEMKKRYSECRQKAERKSR